MTSDRHSARTPLQIAGRILKFIGLALLAGLVFLLANTLLHMKGHVCVLHAAHFARKDMIPIRYGYILGDGSEQTGGAPVVYGGCIRGPFAAVCPHCRWPSEFVRDAPEQLALDEKALADLSPAERQRLDRFEFMVLKQARGDEWVTSVCITSNDVWIGTFNSGLSRMDRQTGSGESFRGGLIGDCVHTIRADGPRLLVEHEFGTTSPLCETDTTIDRGQTWQRL